MLLVPTTFSNVAEWARKVATAINYLLGRQGLPFPMLDSDPVNPQPGQAYFNTVTGKARVYDGTSWNDLY